MTIDLKKTANLNLGASRSLERMIGVWKRLAVERQGAWVTQDENLVSCWASSPLIFMNIVFVLKGSGRSDPLLECLRKASTLLQEQHEPGLSLVVEEQLDALDKAALQDTAKTAGLAPRQGLWGMECNEILSCNFNHSEFEIRQVMGSQAMVLIAEINGAAYGIPSEDVMRAFSGSTILERESVVFAGFERGVPVSVAVTFVDDDVVYLALVATKPSAQRKGYGTATVQKALLEGRKVFGQERFALHSTADGFRIYEKLGFTAVAHMRLFELTSRLNADRRRVK